MTSYAIVIPTIGRPSLAVLLESLARSAGPLPERVLVVDDRRDRSQPLVLGNLGPLHDRTCVVAGPAAGPAAARNRGWQRASEPWVAFLDDDVVVDARWREMLEADLAGCPPEVVGSQGDVRVPLPDRKATDWERNVYALEGARWITADCAYRRSALEAVKGFDERFPRAYREDADLALRLVERGGRIGQGRRRVEHPVRAADPWISLRLQAGNADDALMDALHGASWRERAASPRGAFPAHARTVGYALGAALFGTAWLAATARFAWRRIAPGPRDPREIATMLATSVAIPFAAVGHYLRGRFQLERTLQRAWPLPVAVLFDRDGTLIEDVPDLRHPEQVRPVPRARAALDRLRAAGIILGVVTNQPRIGEGRLSPDELSAVHARVGELLGPFATWNVCPHLPTAGCRCRKPLPELVLAAARHLGVAPSACVVVGDIGADVEAATAAGARSILVPTAVTQPSEVTRAPMVARDLAEAVDAILQGRV